MRATLIRWGAGMLVALLCWLGASSLLFLVLIGQWNAYPWPNRLWMWIDYLLYPPSGYEAVVAQWLIVAAAPPTIAVLAIGGMAVWRRVVRRPPPVYGQTDWAPRKQMKAAGISTTRKPF